MFKFLPILLFAFVFSHAPTVFDDEYTLEEDNQIYIDIYAIHSYGYNVFINIIDAPEHGILTITGGGGGNDMSMLEVLYTPNVDYNGYDSFTYNAVHDEFISEEAIISLTINSFNDVILNSNRLPKILKTISRSVNIPEIALFFGSK